jgi:hypothetical protein
MINILERKLRRSFAKMFPIIKPAPQGRGFSEAANRSADQEIPHGGGGGAWLPGGCALQSQKLTRRFRGAYCLHHHQIPHIVWNPTVHHCVHNSKPLDFT